MKQRGGMTQAEAAEDLVERSRLGDQNAKAMIQMVGESARGGDARATQAYNLILNYMQTHPVDAAMGTEEANALGIIKAADANPTIVTIRALADLPNLGNPKIITTAIVTLSLCAPWTKERISDAIDAVSEQRREAFKFGLGNAMNTAALLAAMTDKANVGAICAGHCIGSARVIQLARLKQIPLSVMGPEVGWELGYFK